MRMDFMGHGPGWGAFAFGGKARRFKRGILKIVLLKLLAEEPSHGYDLIRSFRKKGWAGGAGSIYPLLASLEEAGLIAGRDEGDKRTYEITEKGKRLLHEHGDDLSGLFEDSGDEDVDEERAHAGPRGELREAAGRLMQAIAQLGPSSKPETIARAKELIDAARKEIYTLLAQE